MEYKELPSYDLLLEIFRKTVNNVWNCGNKIYRSNVDMWLSNFTGESLVDLFASRDDAMKRERHIALFLLCNFVYYNEDEVKYLTKVLFEKYLHSIFVERGLKSVCDCDIDTILHETQFAPLGNTSESSSYLLYHFRQENDLAKDNFDIRDCTKRIVFVDDFSISGRQAYDYFNKIKTKLGEKSIYFLVMVTTKDALDKLSKLKSLPHLITIPCIVLDDKSQLFSSASIVFEGYKPEVKEQAKQLCRYYGERLKVSKSPLGFGGKAYMFGSYYNIPNNTLPIFWSSKDGWKFLFKRYEKKYQGGVNFGGAYV